MKLKYALIVVVVSAATCGYAQHDGARNELRIIAAEHDGRIDPSGKEADKKRQRAAWPADMLHVRIIEACYKDDAAGAFELAKKAVDAGLPPQRLQAGPREALRPLHEYGPYLQWMKDKARPLLHGPMLGSVPAVRSHELETHKRACAQDNGPGQGIEVYHGNDGTVVRHAGF